MDADVHYIRVDKDGLVDPKILELVLRYITHKETEILVSIQMANNEIGTIQRIKELSEIVHRYNAVFHTDAVQAFGHIVIDVKKMGIDMLSASGHKLYTPKGIGVLYKKKSVEIDPLIYGSQMDGLRGGTENTPYIIGMAKAVELCKQDMQDNISNVYPLKEYFIKQLKQKFGCKLNGSSMNRLYNNINVTFPQNISGEALIYMLDMAGIYISSGSACNSYSDQPSHVLKAIGLTDDEAMRAIRFSLPDDVTREMIDKVLEELEKSIKILTIE
jgi:cysteine desulfurase